MPMLPLIVHTPGVSVLHSPDPIPLGLFVEGHLTMVKLRFAVFLSERRSKGLGDWCYIWKQHHPWLRSKLAQV
jgi:hypothetical protein